MEKISEHKENGPKKICKFYQQGFCKFGRSCHFKHAKAQPNHPSNSSANQSLLKENKIQGDPKKDEKKKLEKSTEPKVEQKREELKKEVNPILVGI